MKPLPLALAALGFVLGAAIALALLRHFEFGDDPLALILGATIGTQIGVVAHSRQPGAGPTRRAKLALGAVLAASTLAVGLALPLFGQALAHPEITLPVSAVGALTFPFALFGSLWRALGKSSTPPA